MFKTLMKEWIAILILFFSISLCLSFFSAAFLRDFQLTNGKISRIDKGILPGSGDVQTSTSDKNCWFISVKYTANGTAYITNRKSIDAIDVVCDNKEPLPSRGTMSALLDKQITVWYDKNEPSYAVQLKTFPWVHFLGFLISLSVAIGFSYYLVKQFRRVSVPRFI
jgi:hypothetical protein